MALRYPEWAPDAFRFPLTIRRLLDRPRITAANQEIVYRDRVRHDYREFERRIGRLASALERLGVEQGTTVAMMDWDSHRYLEAYFAVPMMGAVLLTVNVRLPAEQLAYTLDHSGAEVVLCHREFLPALDAVRHLCPKIGAVIAIADDGAYDAGPTIGEYEDLLAAASPDFPFEDIDEEAMATTFYTTGTTGLPKGVCFTHRQLVLQTLAGNAPFGDTRWPGFGVDSVYMPLTPMFHVHAWGLPYIATMLGVKQVYPGRYEPDVILRLRAREGVTFSHCVPTIMRMVMEAADRSGTDLTGWTMTIGGAALPRSLCEEGRRHGMYPISGYGMSETAPLCLLVHQRAGTAVDDEEAIVATSTTAGSPAPLVSVRIVDEAGAPLPHDGETMGELVVRAPWLTPCYTGDGEASARLWEGGWLHTGDIASVAPDGFVTIRDRLKDVIKSGGEWICSLTIEDIVARVPGVREVAIVGMPHDKWGERPVAFVVAETGEIPRQAVIDAVAAAIDLGRVGRLARLDDVVAIDALPRTSVGKIDKKALRAGTVAATA